MSSASRELKINFPTYFSTLRASLQQQGVEAGARGAAARGRASRAPWAPRRTAPMNNGYSKPSDSEVRGCTKHDKYSQLWATTPA